MDEPIETAELVAFAKTIEAKSLSRAALELGVPRATISRRLARLEERLEVRLLRRTTRSLSLTDAGEAFYHHARIAIEAVTRAEESVRRDDESVRGTLRVSLPPIFDPEFNRMICEFVERFPDIHLQLQFSTQFVDLQRDGYDVAIRAGTELEPGLVARTLTRTPLIAVASPAYLAEKGVPKLARDLRRHRCLLGFARGELPQTHWPVVDGGKIRVEGTFVTNEIRLLFDAAYRGLGIALLPLVYFARDIEEGKLVHVLPGIIGADSRVSIVYLEREFVPPQVRAFVDAIASWGPRGFNRDVTGLTRAMPSPTPKRARRRPS